MFIPSMAAHALWHLGYPEAAMERNRQALATADAEANPYCTAIALAYAATLHQLRREPNEAEVQASAAVELCEEHGFAYYRAWGTMLRGWAIAHLGRYAEGIGEIGRGLDDLLATGSSLRYPYYLGLLGEAERLAGHHREAAARLDRALDLTYAGEERWQAPQLLILRSVLVSETGGDPQEAESLVGRALEIARRQGARMLEIRAAVRLCRLRRESSKAVEALNTLKAAYATITEGFETPDLVDARAELERVRGRT